MKRNSRYTLYKFFITILFTASAGCSYYNDIHSTSLKGTWRFKADDDFNFKDIRYDDSSWDSIQVPKRLEKQGYKDFMGTAWYRYHVILPASTDYSLFGIYFSNIADSDEVYFNSVLIGTSGEFSKNGGITPHLSKVYSIPKTLIKTDQTNLIAVRFNKKYGPFIGIFNKAPEIGNYHVLGNRVFFENLFKSYLVLFAGFVVLLLGIYHFKLYSYLKERKDYLIFSFACLFIFAYEISLSFFLYSILNNMVLASKINILSLMIGVSCLFIFFLKYYEIKKIGLWVANIFIPAAFALPIIFINDPNLNLKIYYIYFLFLGFFLFYMLYLNTKYIYFKKVKGNKFMILGILAVILTGINDGLVSYGYYYFNLLTAYGFFFFIIGIAISLAKDSADAFKGETLKSKALGSINQASRTISNELDLGKLVYNSLDILKRHLGVERCTIVLVSENGDKPVLFGDELKEPVSEYESIFNSSEQKPYVIKEIEDTFSGMKKGAGKKYRELLVAPMIHLNKAMGFIAISKKADSASFTEDDKEFVSIIAPQLAGGIKTATAYTESQDQIKKQRDMLIMQEKMAAIGQLTSGIGHEINNPINFIISYVPPVRENVEVLIEILKLYEELNADASQNDRRVEILKKIEEIKKKEKLETKLPRILRSLDAITDGANRVASIVDSLKAYARSESLPTEIDINDAIDKSLVILHNKLKNKVEVKKDYGEKVRAKCYFSINQVIVNLISNAADAIAEKGEIHIKTAEFKDKVRFSIRDNGSGMTDEIKKKLFTPFFTTKGPGKGTGLGLSITYNIVYDQHRGSIEIQSEPGKGSTFSVTIPKEITAPV